MKPQPDSTSADGLGELAPDPDGQPTAAITNVDGLLRRLSDDHPGRLGVVDGDRRLTWRAMDESVEALARGLAGLGLVAGHRVALAAGNSIELVAGYLATLRGGLVAVPMNPATGPAEVAELLRATRPRVCFADAGSISQVRAAVSRLESSPLVVAIATDPGRDELGYEDLPTTGPRVVTPRDPEALAAVFAASTARPGGSEPMSQPRLAMLSHRALLANIDQVAATSPAPMRSDDVVLGVQPLCSAYGLNAILGQVLRTGATFVVARQEDPARALELARAERVTVVPVASPILVDWLDIPDLRAALVSVRLLWSGAGSLAESTQRDFEAQSGVVVHRGYGLAEAGPVVSSTIGLERVGPASAGRPLPGIEVRVVDGTGRDVDRADTGEVWVRGDNLFSGYWPDSAEDPGPDGWLRTGEVGFVDESGELFIADKVSELAEVAGFSVYPSEIEEVVGEVDGVREAAVLGLTGTGGDDELVAFVVPDIAGADPEVLAAAVVGHCTDRLARFKVPVRVEIVDELPRSSTGAVVKDRLRAAAPNAAGGPS